MKRKRTGRNDELALFERRIADRAFARASDAPLVLGNEVRLLKDARENYPAWLEAIRNAHSFIHFESYIIHEDPVGYEFADSLIAKAREGVHVRLIYDWMGGVGKTSRSFWRYLCSAGVEVLCFNPPRFDSPFGWLSRDHRKMLGVDGSVAFVSGLCVGKDWTGDPARGIEPWRDTGVSIRGPAVADVEQAFAHAWMAAGGSPLPAHETPLRDTIPKAGDTPLRVIAGAPGEADVLRLDAIIAAGVRERLWLTDAYFVGSTAYVQSLRAAARDGVDVRLLVPGSSDISIVKTISRAGYRPLLEAGVRVFEWNGSMIHAKTAVADSRWARIGSTNLNIASWLNNWELDVAIEDPQFAREVEEMFEQDLTNATEIVLDARQHVRAAGIEPAKRRRMEHRGRGASAGSANRAAAGAIAVGNAIGAAVSNRRTLGSTEAMFMVWSGALLLGLAALGLKYPRSLTIPIAVMSVWTAVSLFIRAYRLHRDKGVQRSAQKTEQSRGLPPPSASRETVAPHQNVVNSTRAR